MAAVRSEIGAGFNQTNFFSQEQVDDLVFVGRFVGAVNGIHRVWLAWGIGFDVGDGFFDRRDALPSGAVAAEHIRIGNGYDQFSRGDAIGHGAGHVAVSNPMGFAEAGRA